MNSSDPRRQVKKITFLRPGIHFNCRKNGREHDAWGYLPSVTLRKKTFTSIHRAEGHKQVSSLREQEMKNTYQSLNLTPTNKKNNHRRLEPTLALRHHSLRFSTIAMTYNLAITNRASSGD